jgi:hypothetical protein
MQAPASSPGRRVKNRLLLVCNLAFATAAAATAVIGFVRPSFVGLDTGPLGAMFADQRILVLPLGTGAAWGVFLGSVGLLVWNFVWLVRRPERTPPVHWVVSETPSGPVRVAKEALEAGLRLAGELLPEITRLRVQVDTTTHKRILVTGQFHCAEGTSNLAASQRLRTAMSERFAEMVRPADGGRVEFDLEFQGFAGKLGKKAGEVPPPEPDPSTFTGPKYPIDDETHGGSP